MAGCEKHEYMERELGRLEERVTALESGQGKLENSNVKIEATIERFDIEFAEMKVTLKEIASELKSIGNRLVAVVTRADVRKESVSASMVKTLLDGNNRAVLMLVLILGSALLFLLGMNVGDIVSLFGLKVVGG